MAKFIDLTGQRFGRLVVIERAKNRDLSNKIMWHCVCDCGNFVDVITGSLKNGNCKSCGCLRIMPPFEDLTGKTFGRLTVKTKGESYVSPKGDKILRWTCECECGNTVVVSTTSLKSGKTKSCGCYHLEIVKRPNNYSKKEFGVASFNRMFGMYKNSAKKRGHSFNLTSEQFAFLINQDCYYCGCSPRRTITNKHGNGDLTCNGIDRIDSYIGYTIDNCVPCCGTCNTAKMQMSQQEFYSWIERVYNHSILKGRE